MISELHYKNFQKHIASNKLYRYFWEFWAIYSFVFFLVAFVFIYLFGGNDYDNWQFVLVQSAVAFFLARVVIITIINLFYKRERPYQKFSLNPITSNFLSFKTTRPNSFPSRHTLAYMAVAAVIVMYYPVIGAGLVVVSILAGVGRIVLGYHWPSDVIVGAILGYLVGYSTVLFMMLWLFT